MGYKIPAQGSKPLILASLQALWDIMGHYGARQQLKVEQAALVSGHAQGDGGPPGLRVWGGKSCQQAASGAIGCRSPPRVPSSWGHTRCCFSRRNGQMLLLLISHLTSDGGGVANLVNCFLTIPLVTGGKTPTDCKRDRAGHLITAVLLCVLQSPREPQRQARGSLGWCKHKAKRQSLPGKLVPVLICHCVKRTSPTNPGNAAARVLCWEGMFWPDLTQLSWVLSCLEWVLQ